ncbi:S8 family peptidase [Saccharothrix texasensis]|uniref:Subtilase family protein n=1 Tax=Saccharothrix texasensis TaxID=103734 RepID=A0A3N1HH52_9PSEU|nr:S8 family peptidase [Saccharothrix texasensis]ROP41849.1 subtilase family protein [Saccharothrix texasensis]
MAQRDKTHLIVSDRCSTFDYAPVPGRGDAKVIPNPADRRAHGGSIRSGLETAEHDARARRERNPVIVPDAVPGTYVAFESFPGIELALNSLDPRTGSTHPELRSVRVDVVNGQRVETATVFVPEGTMGYFFGRLDEYLASVDKSAPNHRNLVDRIHAVRLASVEALWTDPITRFPDSDGSVWWEVWLRPRDGKELARLRAYADAGDAGMRVGRRALGFNTRTVVMVLATVQQLASAIEILDDIAELRSPIHRAEFLAEEDATTQSGFVRDLARLVVAAGPGAPAVCVMDTGVHRMHPLLDASLPPQDCHAADPRWSTEYDHDGHGTAMAGLALYGDLAEAMTTTGPITLRHGLESLTLLPPPGFPDNEPDLYGAITASGVAAVETVATRRRRAYSMAVTALTSEPPSADGVTESVLGKPTSWSASLDALAAGRGVIESETGLSLLGAAHPGAHRLFIVSAGNVETFDHDHLSRSDIEPVQDPAQAWNVLTVGAYTDLDTFLYPPGVYEGWSPLAQRGELSPFSRTSVAFNTKWPVKPEIVMEGGNVAESPDGTERHPVGALELLTTRAPDNRSTASSSRQLTTIGATSAATAQAAHLAARIMADYPSLWPEAVRGLIVHSAEWTPAMRAHVDRTSKKRDKRTVLRRYGMGVPDLTRATRSAGDSLTLIAQETITPFQGDKLREIHFHDLPWPTDVLADLGATPVQLRVTLSYFIEPNPARRGWNGRYNYASHGLRFDVRRPTESNDDFHKRLNLRALQEEEKRPTSAGDTGEWLFGPEAQRAPGSLHTDIWTGTASDLAQRGALAVYPVGGWWKEQAARDRVDHDARYALIVAINTPGVDTDIWTPVAQQVQVPTTITT